MRLSRGILHPAVPESERGRSNIQTPVPPISLAKSAQTNVRYVNILDMQLVGETRTLFALVQPSLRVDHMKIHLPRADPSLPGTPLLDGGVGLCRNWAETRRHQAEGPGLTVTHSRSSTPRSIFPDKEGT